LRRSAVKLGAIDGISDAAPVPRFAGPLSATATHARAGPSSPDKEGFTPSRIHPNLIG